MKKYLRTLLALVLVLSFSLVRAGPVAAATTNVTATAGALQTAINAATAGDTLIVAAGSFSDTTITVNKQLTIRGAGSSGSTNTTITATASQPVFNVTANSTRIQDFVITRAGARASYGIDISGSSVTIRSNLITGHSTGIRINGTADNRIYRNTIKDNGIGVSLPGITGSNNVQYNDIVTNTQGASADAVPSDSNWGQGIAWNWWGHASGPGGSGPGTGDNVSSLVRYSPWLNRDSATSLADGVADVSISVTLRTGWNSLSARFELAADSNNWNEIVTRSALVYDAAYMYDPDTGWTTSLPTNSTTVIRPLDAMLIKMASPATVVMKAATFPSTPPTKALKRGWNLIGAAPAFDKSNLEMWKVLISVANTSTGQIGYNMVVSPSLQGQSSWAYVRGEEAETDYAWQKMDAGRGYWIYMENADDMAGFSATPISARTYD